MRVSGRICGLDTTPTPDGNPFEWLRGYRAVESTGSSTASGAYQMVDRLIGDIEPNKGRNQP